MRELFINVKTASDFPVFCFKIFIETKSDGRLLNYAAEVATNELLPIHCLKIKVAHFTVISVVI